MHFANGPHTWPSEVIAGETLHLSLASEFEAVARAAFSTPQAPTSR
jgi:hypothetical protein